MWKQSEKTGQYVGDVLYRQSTVSKLSNFVTVSSKAFVCMKQYNGLQHLSEVKNSFAEKHRFLQKSSRHTKGFPTAFSNVDHFKIVHNHNVLNKHTEAVEDSNSNEERKDVWFNCMVLEDNEINDISEVQYDKKDELCHFALAMDYTVGD